MAGRYLITGADIGVLIGYLRSMINHQLNGENILKEAEEFLNNLQENNFVGNPDNQILTDVKEIEKFFNTK